MFKDFIRSASNPYKKLDFVIVGAQKSGTSAVFYYLKQHPEISLSNNKELHFFDTEEFFKKGTPDYRILHKQMNYLPDSKISGECSPRYIYWTPSIGRIWEYNPKIKIIAILRNPIKRAYSQWNMLKTKGVVSLDFKDCILRENELAREYLPLQSRFYSFIDRGFYSEQIRRIYRFFEKEQVLILKYEEFKKNQMEGMFKIFDFLKVNRDSFHFQEKEIHALKYEREMTLEEKQYLFNIYKNEIDEVEGIMNWNCDDWKDLTDGQ